MAVLKMHCYNSYYLLVGGITGPSVGVTMIIVPSVRSPPAAIGKLAFNRQTGDVCVSTYFLLQGQHK